MKTKEMVGLVLIGWSSYYINKVWAAMEPVTMFFFYITLVPIAALTIFAINFRKRE